MLHSLILHFYTYLKKNRYYNTGRYYRYVPTCILIQTVILTAYAILFFQISQEREKTW